MPIRSLHVSGYRSIRTLRLRLQDTNVIVGPNGSGKSNLYRAMYLVAQAAQGRFTPAIGAEGGMPSVLWAGPRRAKPVRMMLELRTDDYAFSLECGLSSNQYSAFALDPEVKTERVALFHASREVVMLDRRRAMARVRDDEGGLERYPRELLASESALSQIREPRLYPELTEVREAIQAWRFYHPFPIDSQASARSPQVGVRTQSLADDGRDLAAALQTIREQGDYRLLDEIVGRAFPNVELEIALDDHHQMEVRFRNSALERPLRARELSDGTLRFLYLAAALLSPRPAPLIALNEPENSLHAEVFEPLAALIAAASQRSQLWIVTHSERLADMVAEQTGAKPIRLRLHDGETQLADGSLCGDGIEVEEGDDDAE